MNRIKLTVEYLRDVADLLFSEIIDEKTTHIEQDVGNNSVILELSSITPSSYEFIMGYIKSYQEKLKEAPQTSLEFINFMNGSLIFFDDRKDILFYGLSLLSVERCNISLSSPRVIDVKVAFNYTQIIERNNPDAHFLLCHMPFLEEDKKISFKEIRAISMECEDEEK